jgi:hypothetical protein
MISRPRPSHDRSAMQQSSAHEIPATAETLARAYIDALAHAEGLSMQSMLNRGSPQIDEIESVLYELGEPSDPDRPDLRADMAAVAILTARAVQWKQVSLAGCDAEMGPWSLCKRTCLTSSTLHLRFSKSAYYHKKRDESSSLHGMAPRSLTIPSVATPTSCRPSTTNGRLLALPRVRRSTCQPL